MSSRPPTSVDLFAGAGGLTEGFRQQGFVSLYANDSEKPALETFAYNHPDVIVSSKPIETVDAKQVRRELGLKSGQLDVLLGGPPCQGFSTYGKRNVNDNRNRLYECYVRFLEVFRPKTLVVENVVGLLSMDGGRILQDIVSRIEDVGYRVNVLTLDAVSFGVPQYRKRVFILGAAGGGRIPAPRATHGPPPSPSQIRTGPNDPLRKNGDACSELLKPVVTTRDAIGSLPVNTLAPRETHQPIRYSKTVRASEYERAMRSRCRQLTHHAAKQMLAIRRLRLALMRPGDYGSTIRNRLLDDGLSDKLIQDLLGGNGTRDASQCRKEDREKERRLIEILRGGHVHIDDVLMSLDAGGFANKYRRLEWDKPAHTLVAHMARDCSDFVHPQVDRFITVREAARLQSFPDRFYFPCSQFRQFRQIGNAVPPRLAEALAKAVGEYLRVL